MAKLSYELKEFSAGTITNADLQDIPDGAAADSLNVSSLGKMGAVTATNKHLEIMGGYDSANQTWREGLPPISNMVVRTGIDFDDHNLAINIGTSFIYINDYINDDKFADFYDILSGGSLIEQTHNSTADNTSEHFTQTSTTTSTSPGAWQNGSLVDYNTRDVVYAWVNTVPGYKYKFRCKYTTGASITSTNEEAAYVVAIDHAQNAQVYMAQGNTMAHIDAAYTVGSAGQNGTWDETKLLAPKLYFHTTACKEMEFTAKTNRSVIVIVSGNTNNPAASGDATPDTWSASDLDAWFSKGTYLWKGLGSDLDFTNTDKGLFISSKASVPHLLNKVKDDSGLVLEYIEKSECTPISSSTSMSNIDFMDVLYTYNSATTNETKYLTAGVFGEPYLWILKRGQSTIGSSTCDYTDFVKSNIITWAPNGLGGIRWINGQDGASTGDSEFICWDFDGVNLYKAKMPDTASSSPPRYNSAFTVDLVETYPLDIGDTSIVPDGAVIKDIAIGASANYIYILLGKDLGFEEGENVVVQLKTSDNSQMACYTIEGGMKVDSYDSWSYSMGPGSFKWYYDDVNPKGKKDWYWSKGGDSAATPVKYKNGDYAALNIDPNGPGGTYQWNHLIYGGFNNVCWINTKSNPVQLDTTGGIGIFEANLGGVTKEVVVFSLHSNDSDTKFLKYSGKWAKALQYPNNFPDIVDPDGYWTHRVESQKLDDGAVLVTLAAEEAGYSITTDRYKDNQDSLDTIQNAPPALEEAYNITHNTSFGTPGSQYHPPGVYEHEGDWKSRFYIPIPNVNPGNLESWYKIEETAAADTTYNPLNVEAAVIHYYPWGTSIGSENQAPRSWEEKWGSRVIKNNGSVDDGLPPDVSEYTWNDSGYQSTFQGAYTLVLRGRVRPQIITGLERLLGMTSLPEYVDLMTACRLGNDISDVQSKAKVIYDYMYADGVMVDKYHGHSNNPDDYVLGWSHFWNEMFVGLDNNNTAPHPSTGGQVVGQYTTVAADFQFPMNVETNSVSSYYAFQKEKANNTGFYKMAKACKAAWAYIVNLATLDVSSKSKAYSAFVNHHFIQEPSFQNGIDLMRPRYGSTGFISRNALYCGKLTERGTVHVTKLGITQSDTSNIETSLATLNFTFNNPFGSGTFHEYEELEYITTQTSENGDITRTPTGGTSRIFEYTMATHQDDVALSLFDTGSGGADLEIIPSGSNRIMFSAFTGDVILRTMVMDSPDIQNSPFDSGDLSIGLTPKGGAATIASDADILADDELAAKVDALPFKEGEIVMYNMSFLYDGYQESPLMGSAVSFKIEAFIPAGWPSAGTAITDFRGREYTDLTVTIGNTNPRITAVNVYSKKRALDKYRLVEQIPLDNYWEVDNADSAVDANLSATAKMRSGISVTIRDRGKSGISYEALTGMNEQLFNTMINYSASEIVSDYLFVAGGSHGEVDNAERYIFRSQPGKYSMFNWAQDYLGLPEPVHTLKSAYNRLIAFSDSAMYQIDPFSLSLEHKFLGYGILKKASVEVVGGVLYFANKSGLYMYASGKFKLLSGLIQDKWDAIYAEYPSSVPILSNDVGHNAILITFSNDGPSAIDDASGRALAFSIDKRRWDIYEFPLKVQSSCLDENNEILMAALSTEVKSIDENGNPKDAEDATIDNPYSIYRLHASMDKEKIEWTTKELTMGEDTRDKKFKKVKLIGDGVEIDKVWIDGELLGFNGESVPSEEGDLPNFDIYDIKEDGTVQYLDVNTKGKKIQVKIKSKDDSVNPAIYSIGVTYGLKGIK